MNKPAGFLILEDKTVFEGLFTGQKDWGAAGEVVFNTSMLGYQEVITDPSYYQQIVVMTAPEQGNYGVSSDERESEKVWAQGFVSLELNEPDNKDKKSLTAELGEFKRPALTQLDTRALTLHLRSRGTPWGAIVQGTDREKAMTEALSLIAEKKKSVPKDWVYEASRKETKVFKGQGKQGRVALYDFGVKTSIIEQLLKRFSDVAVFNSRAAAKEILDWAPHGLVLSNGPGDPADVVGATQEVKKLLGQLPIFGICMGHQILALALGGTTYKLKFGHRGSNHPVQNLATKEIYMTAQNHGYAVNENLPSGVKVSQINLYDKTVEGIEAEKLKAWSVQYHPEAGPGPHDSRVLFDYFAKQIL